MKHYFTDGSASPNPGPGGFAVIDLDEKCPVALGKEANSTNIHMEAMALIAAYKIAADGDQISTDSEFWVNVVTKWAAGWKANGWTKKSGPIKNLELVKELFDLYESKPKVNLVWTRGHVGTEGNELADEWANKARQGAEL